MSKMKAFVRLSVDNQDVILTEVPIPEIGADEVLIKVEAFGVGIHDRYYIPNNVEFPYVIGSEGAGIISKIGEEVNGFKVGDEVIYTTALQAQGGTWAEFAVAKLGALIMLPKDLSFKKAAAIPIAGKTALECMRELNLEKSDTLFIAGASGAIGTFVIQMAKAIGVKLAASASSKNHDYMKSLGADQCVDYKDENWIDKVKSWSNGGVTKALAIQPQTEFDSIKVVKDAGTLITVSGYGSSIQPERDITVRQMGHELFTTKELSEMIEDVAEGKIKVMIEKEFTFDDALEALVKTETRHARGKLVVLND